jgi:hypothetical protein
VKGMCEAALCQEKHAVIAHHNHMCHARSSKIEGERAHAHVCMYAVTT